MKSAQEIWGAALGALQIQVSKPNYDTWLKDTTGISYQDNLLVVGAPNTFVIEGLKKRLLSLIKKTLVGITGVDIAIQFVVSPSDQVPSPGLAHAWQADGGTSLKTRAPAASPRLNPKYTFDTFTVGESNRLAYASALGVAESPGRDYNPLFIYGDTGVGKTHLLHAVGHMAKASGLSTLYVSAEQFTKEFIIAVKNGNTEGFRYKFRNADVLLVDDIQFLGGKVQTQECFFHTFNDLHNNSCQIVITGDCTPKAMSSLGKRLRSRLEWGLITTILPPDQKTRVGILRTKAEELKVSIPSDVLQFIASQFQHNARELEGALIRLVTYAKLSGTDIDTHSAARALLDMMPKPKTNTVTPRLIISSVADYFGITEENLIGRRRDHETALARQIAIYLMREEGNCHLAAIGRELGDRDHTTILHGYRKIASEIGINNQLQDTITKIRHKLRAGKKPIL